MIKSPRPRSKFNIINPIVISISFLLNAWTLLIYFIFPYTDILNRETFKIKK